MGIEDVTGQVLTSVSGTARHAPDPTRLTLRQVGGTVNQ